MLILNGLRIATGDGKEAAEPAADLSWRTERVGSLPAEPGAGDPIAIVRGEGTGFGTMSPDCVVVLVGVLMMLRPLAEIGGSGEVVISPERRLLAA